MFFCYRLSLCVSGVCVYVLRLIKQKSCAEMLDHNEDSAEDGGRNPLKDPKKLPKAVIEDDYDIDASQQASVKNGRSSKVNPVTITLPEMYLCYTAYVLTLCPRWNNKGF